MKSKFQNFDFGDVEVLSREEQSRVKGGGGYSNWWTSYDPHICLTSGPGFDCVRCTKSTCDAICGGPCQSYAPAQSGGGVYNYYASKCSSGG